MAGILSPSEMMWQAFEPKLVNRFYLYIEGIPSFVIRKADRPKYNRGKVEIHHINSYFNVAGKTKWTDVTMELYDPIVPSAAQEAHGQTCRPTYPQNCQPSF